MTVVAGIRFSKVGKIYHFDASKIMDAAIGDTVVVETSRGWQIGDIVQILVDPPTSPEGSWKKIERRANPRDLICRLNWQAREEEVLKSCRKRKEELRLNGIKIVAAEYSFEGSRVTILFSNESEEKAELKSLRQDMQKMFSPAQVELRQIGPRDVAKIISGIGACGLEKRCCSQFLTDFSSISIRMAKEQGISLTPTEITGMCGRLRCCLVYEYAQYTEARSHLPKRNKRVITPIGEGKVIDVHPLSQRVVVEIQDVGYREFPVEELKGLDEPAA
jgi:cell fate regulator YaaT (PSP1 superfamily)